MSSSNRGRRATNGRWSALQWGAVEGLNGAVMVGGFCVVVRITIPVVGLFHRRMRLRFLARSCAEGLVAGICTKKALESLDSRTFLFITIQNLRQRFTYMLLIFILFSFFRARPDFTAYATPLDIENVTLSPIRV